MNELVDPAWMSREIAAGYEPEKLQKGRILMGGAGAGANNLGLALALSGVGEALVVDFDPFEKHNATRSPFYPTKEEQARMGMGKAKVVANKMAEMAKRVGEDGMRTRYLADYLQRVPMGLFRYVGVVANGSDNLEARSYMSEAAFLAGKPFIDAGFRGEKIQVGVFVPDDPETGPCWRCLYPEINPGARNYSCTWYALEAERHGIVPAVQAAAQIAGALQAHHAILALQGEFPLKNSVFHLNMKTGYSLTYRVSRNPQCPSRWHKMEQPEPTFVPLHTGMTWQDLLVRAETLIGGDAILTPLTRLLWDMPCLSCKKFMAVRGPAWLYEAKPFCTACGGPFVLIPAEDAPFARDASYNFIDYTKTDALGKKLSDFGLHAGDLIYAQNMQSGDETLLLLQGDVGAVVDEIFTSTG